MNPYDPPKAQSRNIRRRIWFGVAMTLLVLTGIVMLLVIGNMARDQARRSRTPGTMRQIQQAIKAYELPGNQKR